VRGRRGKGPKWLLDQKGSRAETFFFLSRFCRIIITEGREHYKMIIGIGIDLIANDRIQKELEREGDRFLAEILTETERDYCLSLKTSSPSIAARFAAKEAMFKALGTGKRGKMSWQDVEVIRDDLGKPSLVLKGATLDQARALGVGRTHVTLTHTADTSAAAVILEAI
jgi:holo-[acyl-carrier protein] synthase